MSDRNEIEQALNVANPHKLRPQKKHARPQEPRPLTQSLNGITLTQAAIIQIKMENEGVTTQGIADILCLTEQNILKQICNIERNFPNPNWNELYDQITNNRHFAALVELRKETLRIKDLGKPQEED